MNENVRFKRSKRKNNSWHEGSVRQRSDGSYEGRVTFNRVTKEISDMPIFFLS
jgi:hypothetical protein